MPSEYDALLESPPAKQKSEYDALLEQPHEGGVVSGIAAGIGRAINPINIIKGALDISPRTGLQEVLRAGRMIGDVATGKSIDETVRKEAPEVAQQRDVLSGKYGTREQAAAWTGLGVQAGMLALPFVGKVRGAIPSLRETVFGEPKPETLSESAAQEEVIKNATQERQVQESVQPERTGDDAGRTPTETSGSGGVQPATEVQQTQVEPTTEGVVSEKEKDEGKGEEGRILEPLPSAAAVSEPGSPAAVPEPPESSNQIGEELSKPARLAGPSNRVLQERAARGEIPQAPESGQGFLKEDLLARERPNYSPERAQQAAEKIKIGESNLSDETQAVIHEEALTKAAADTERALKANPNDPNLRAANDAARSAMSKWQHEVIQPMKTLWSNKGINLQGATNVDTGTLVGLQKLAWDTAKRDFTPEELPVMNEAADRVNKAQIEEKASIVKANDEVQKVLKPSRYMDLNQLRESLAESLKSITC